MDYAIGMTVVILKVLIGLGFVIFVHELGHFAVAKFCGVKCEKFYLGFDIAGLRFCRFRWGETEYGIGIFPLGGYVKMLGQEDNPARLREEIERAKAEGGQSSNLPSSLFDPRSFLAKSVPKRMAIIAAGVIMNMIFAFLMAVAAFGIGVKQTPCVVGGVHPGSPAWQADLRPGDEILTIAGKEMPEFRDLKTAISLGDIDPEKGVPVVVRRDGKVLPPITVKPDNSLGAFFIGVAGGFTTRLMENQTTWLVQSVRATAPGSAADRTGAFRNGDRIVRIDDVPISNYGQIDVILARKADKPITVVVERQVKKSKGRSKGNTEQITIAVPPDPMRHLGMTMKMGLVTAVQDNSPAQATSIKPGVHIVAPAGDPMTLPDRLRRQAGKTVDVAIQPKGTGPAETVKVLLREPIEMSPPATWLSPVASSSLGVAYRVLNEVESVEPNGPAAKAGLRPGDILVKATLIPPPKDVLKKLNFPQKEISFSFKEFPDAWPGLMTVLQGVAPSTQVELTFSRQGKEQPPQKLTPIETDGWFNADRGLLFEPITFQRKAKSVGEAFALGGEQTLSDLTVVFRTVQKLTTTTDVSPRNLAGPVTIFWMALGKADEGTASLLMFLAFLSANLAVLNFLPIPVLDGGLMMFLLYEGIRGKPADERVQAVLSYIGLLLILALMVWALGLDFGLFSRYVPPAR